VKQESEQFSFYFTCLQPLAIIMLLFALLLAVLVDMILFEYPAPVTRLVAIIYRCRVRDVCSIVPLHASFYMYLCMHLSIATG